MTGKLITFDTTVRPATLRERLGEYIPADLELSAKLLQTLSSAKHRPVDSGLRIDYRKQVELLTKYLDDRQALTGETAFSFLSSQIPFRWALQQYEGDVNVTIPGIGTSAVEDKIILPLFLEVNGFLDITDLDLESDPLKPADVFIRYSVRRPATRNIFGASNGGLAAARARSSTRRSLHCTIACTEACARVWFLAASRSFEMSFGTLCAWLIRKASYCLEANLLGAARPRLAKAARRRQDIADGGPILPSGCL